MTSDTELSDFSSSMTEATVNTVKSIINNYTSLDSGILNSDKSIIEGQSDLEVSTPEISTIVNIVTETAETLATTAARKLVTATLSISSSVSPSPLSDTLLVTGQQSSYPSNPFSVTGVPVSTVPTTTYFEIDDSSEIVITSTSGEDSTTHPSLIGIGNGDSEAHASMQNHIQNLNSPKSIKYLIERLQEKLSDVQESGPVELHSLSLPNPHSSGLPPHQQVQEHLPPSIQYGSEKNSLGESAKILNKSEILSNTSDIHTQFSDYPNNNSDNVILHSDTIILVSSMVCMIIMGLALYKLMDYLTRMNRRKNMARHGLKQIGEHMHVVTRTMSAEPSGTTPKSTPKPVRKRPLVDSPSTARVLREVRRGTVFKPPTYIMRRDDDMDFGLAFQTASQEAHNNRMRFEEGIEMEIQNEFVSNVKHERKH